MEYDREKVDEVALALLYLTMHGDGRVTRAWKGLDRDVLNRLYEKGWMGIPKSKAKSAVVTEEGRSLAQQFFEKHFGPAV